MFLENTLTFCCFLAPHWQRPDLEKLIKICSDFCVAVHRWMKCVRDTLWLTDFTASVHLARSVSLSDKHVLTRPLTRGARCWNVSCFISTEEFNDRTLGLPICVSHIVCGCDLAQGGFFMKNGEYLCMLDYQRMHGTRCNGCGDFVEGEVVTALGKTYHPACFVCTICK